MASATDTAPPPEPAPSPTGTAARPPARPRKRKRYAVSLVLLSFLVVTGFVLARTRWLAREVARVVRAEVAKQTGLTLEYQRVGFVWRRFAVRIEGIEVRHPREGRLARVDALEISPAFASLFRDKVKIAGIDVDGGTLELRFRQGLLVNGPTLRQQGPAQRPELPFRDLAISDVRVRIEHDALGTLELLQVDVDVRNASPSRVLLGVLAQGGAIHGARCFNGAIQRIEARAELSDWRELRVALARVEGAGISARVREAVLPLDLRGPMRADLEVAGALPTFVCPVPHSPPLHGNVALEARGTFDPATMRFSATGRAHGSRLAFDAVFPERTYIYGLAEEVDARFTATQDEVRIDELHGLHSGATLTSPGTRPDRPITLRLGAHPTLDGHVDIAGLELHRLLHEIAITSFAKVLWTLSASAEIHGELWRFGERPDPAHPALTVDVEADTRNFAILREYHQFLPQVPVIAIPRGTVTGQITADSQHVRFRNLVGRFGPGGRSRVDVAMVQIRTVHDPRIPDIWLERARGRDIHLEDIGEIAGMPIAGLASAECGGGGPFSDPVITGDAHLRNFRYNDLPLGDYDTRFASPWRFRQMRVDFPAVEGRAGQSTFSVRDAYLDFTRYTLTAGAHITSDDFQLADYFHMFKFEGDPVFEPYVGGTMPRCRVALVTARRNEPDVPCLAPGDVGGNDPRRPPVPPGTDTGHIEADVSFVLGRPGDDPGGVMDVDLTGRDLWVDYVNRADDGEVLNRERITHADAHLRYTWLVRSRGYRGARQFLEYARGRYAGGTLEVSGSVDLGGQMHFAGHVQGVAVERTGMVAGRGLTGVLDAAGTLEGTPDAQRWTIDADVRGLAAAERNFGDVTVRLRAAPEGPPNPDPNGRPPRARWTLSARALDGAVAVEGALVVPWRQQFWRDVDGQLQPDWSRMWRQSEISGSLALTRPLDLLPWLPTRMVARLGSGAVASTRARVEIEHAVLNDARNADARVVIDQLQVGAQGMRVALAPGSVLAACLHDGAYWIDPAAANSSAPCARVPDRLTPRGRLQVTHGEALPMAQFMGPEGTRFGIGGGGTMRGALGLGVRGEVDLSRIATLVPGVTWARGTSAFQVDVAGTVEAPQLSGTLRLEDGAVGAAMLPNPVDHIDLLVRLDGTDITLARASARFGASSIDMTGGTVHFRGRDLERVDVPLSVRNLSLVPQPGVEVALDADAQLAWVPGEELPRFTGDVTLGRVRYTRPVNMSLDLSGNARVAQSDAAESAYDPSNDNVAIDLRIHAREPIRVSNNLAEAEIVIAESERPFRVLGTDQRLGALGTLVVPTGRVHFRDNDFEIRRGRIEFDNPDRIAPSFDVSAQTEIRRSLEATRNQQWRIDLHAYGTADRFALDMSSEPALSREDVALMLAFRMTRAELDALDAGNLGQHLAVEALATATGIDRVVRQYLQLLPRINNMPIVDDVRFGSGYSPSSGRTVPQATFGGRINDRTRWSATINTADRSEVRGTIDVRLGDQTSLQISGDNMTQQGSTNGANMGADLRWRIELE